MTSKAGWCGRNQSGLEMASCKELSHQPPWGLPTSSLVSLEADLARAGLGLSEAASAGPSRLLSWHREEKVWVGRR